MNVFQRAMAWLRPQGFGTTRPEDPARSLAVLPFPTSAAGVPLTMEVATQLSTVWACIDAIAKAIASSQWKAYEVNGRNRTYLPDDPVAWLLNVRPNPEMTAIAWRESMLYQTLSWGNGYSEIVRTGAGKVAELWPLLSDRMVVSRATREDGAPGELVYWYNQPLSGQWVMLRSSQVLHFRGPSINGLMGENMVARAARAIGLAIAAERFASSYFGNGATLGTILKYPKTLTNEAHKRLKEDWEDKHTGPDKAHRPFILEGGMELERLTADAGEMQLTDSRMFSVEEICRFWGVPPHKVQHLLRATFNNIEHLGMEFVRDAVTPWALRCEQEVDFKLYPQKAPWRATRIDTEHLSHGDARARAEAYQIMRRIGVYSANDILEKEGANTIGKEGDVRLVEANMTPLKRMMQDTAKPEIFQYHLTAGIPTVNEVRERLGLPPREGGDVPTSTAPPAPFGGGAEGGEPPGEGGKAPSSASPMRGGEAEEPEEPEEPEEEGEEEPEPPAKAAHEASRRMLAEAVQLLFMGSLERYARKATNREQDLRRKRSRSEADIAVALAEHRSNTREVLLEEAREAFNILGQVAKTGTEEEWSKVMIEVADAVDNGATPREAAATLVALYMR